jgi:hypothetical protein
MAKMMHFIFGLTDREEAEEGEEEEEEKEEEAWFYSWTSMCPSRSEEPINTTAFPDWLVFWPLAEGKRPMQFGREWHHKDKNPNPTIAFQSFSLFKEGY